MELKNTLDLMDPDKLRLKVLVYSLPGTGKTEWASGAPNPGIVACETGQGSGMQTIAQKGIDFVEPKNLADFEAVCRGEFFADKDTIILDSLSEMSKTFIKDAALAIPRARGNSAKRMKGVPELDDYGVMGELTRRTLRRLLDLDKHIVVTATLRVDKPDLESGKGKLTIGPDLPGQMFMGSTAMFDLVLCMRARSVLRNPKDAKSRYTERFLMTQPNDTVIAKCRYNVDGKALLDTEEICNLETGAGSFNGMLKKVQEGFSKALKTKEI